MTKAPAVYHSEQRPDNFAYIINDCAINIHMRSNATRLLTFYANQANGFAPSLAFINRETGLSVNKISELRQQLIDYGLINYSNEKHFIHIGWSRIRAYAMLEKPLRVTRNQCTFLPFTEEPKALRKTKTLKQLGAKYKIKEPRRLEPWEESFYDQLERMTEKEYHDLVEHIRVMEFPNYPATPPDVSDREWVSSIVEY